MTTKGYTLMFSVVHGNVLGAVIAPRGTEHYSKDRRMFIWRAMIRPLIDEVAEHEEFPEDDAKKVVKELGQFCIDAGLVLNSDRTDADEK